MHLMITCNKNRNAWHRYRLIALISAYCSWWWRILEVETPNIDIYLYHYQCVLQLMMIYIRSRSVWPRYIFIPLISAYCSWWCLILAYVYMYCPSTTVVGLEHVFKTSSRHVLKTSSTRLQRNNFSSSKTSWRRLEDFLKTSCKTSSRRLGRRKIVTLKKFWRRLQDMSWRRLPDILKTNKCLLG